MQWNEVKRLRDVVLVKDRIDALSFYMRKSVMTKSDVEKMALILQSEKQTEREGTLFLIAHQSGKEQVKAHAHLIKLRGEISAIENFIFVLHNERIAIKK
jgi:predicted metal-binding protein